ncbi:Gfo/Idh/MocA family protein [Lysinibacillus fusiformis]|uniref:Gfo/Idh/MocA family protein n=1 Tax=Lysinibacillus fusiformis TaxID=28031 RepID=UPI00148D0A72|nr:Gfo/Idh/MocA family oxidoreductase [Lysinibacillus fusiformis]NOG29137.1 Gfo/Idh/MocA family oxidoreductase [Lysinibacillus fusiformis]
MKYALIGCGRISSNHIAAALKNQIDIVAICDLTETKMDETIREFNLLNVEKYTNYEQMLIEQSPQLVAICTESGSHGQIAMKCLDYNCHLIIEKPIALSLKEADLIIEKAQEKNLKVSACHQNRFNKSIQKTREAMEQGRFGKLLHGAAHIRWNRGEDYYKQAPWRGTWEHDGGALMNQCIHNIDLLRWMMGDEIVEVVGMTDTLMHGYIEAEDLGLALIRFKNGSYGIIEGTTNIYPNNLEETLYIFGEKGTVKVGGKSVNLIEEWNFSDKFDNPDNIKENYKENPPNIYGFGHYLLYTDVIEAIEQDRQPYVTAKDGRNALELVLAIYKSSNSKQTIKLPLINYSTLDCAEGEVTR